MAAFASASMSAASPSSIHAAERAPGSRSSAASSSLSSSRPAAISVAMANAKPPRRPHCRSDRQRQVGAGAAAGGGDRRGDRQRRQRAGLSRPADPVGGANGGQRARAEHCSTACWTGRSLFGGRLGRDGQGRDRAAAWRRPDCRSWSAAPASICGRCWMGSLRSRRSIPRSAPRCAATAWRRIWPSCAARPGRRDRSIPATRPASRGRWKW